MKTQKYEHPVGEETIMAALAGGTLAFHAKLSPGVGPESVTPDAVRDILLANVSRLSSTKHDINIVGVFRSAAGEISKSRTPS